MKIVIIGAVAAGAKAAAKSKRLLPDAEVVIYTQDEYVSYSSCGLPYFIGGSFEDPKKLIVRSIDKFEESGIKVHNFHRVTQILPEEKKVKVLDIKSGHEFLTDYDKLLISTGARPRMPSIQNIGLQNIYALRTLNDGIRIRETMLKSRKAVIVGGGYVGLELMEAFVHNGLHVTMLENNLNIMSYLDDDIISLVTAYIHNTFEKNIVIQTSANIVEFIGDERVRAVKLSNNNLISADFVAICSGVEPVVDLAESAGIVLGKTGAIKVNSRMQTNIPDIYAAGDCVEKINIVSNTPMWIPLGSTANKEGRSAAINMCGGVDDFEGVLGSAVTRFFDMTISKTGLTTKIAEELGYDVVSAIITKRDKAGYMPTVGYLTLKLIADRRSHKILGAQAVGSSDADKRINILTTGLIKGLTVEDLSDTDMTYAPPYSTSIDPLIDAVRILKEKLACCGS